MKKIIYILPCLIFVLFSFTVVIVDKMNPQKKPSLKEEKTLDEEGRVIHREYRNEEGELALNGEGYAAMDAVYNAEGKLASATYLGLDGKPVRITSGYSVEERSYDGEGRTLTNAYFDTDHEPVMRSGGYHIVRREYPEEGVIRKEYLDLKGELVMNSSGYAYLMQYSENEGRLTEEWYFDTKGEPVSLSSGAYGVRKEYDENNKLISTIRLDREGKALPEAKKADAYTRPDQYLSKQPFLVLAGAMVLLTLCLLVRGRWRIGMLIGYLGFILLMTILYREPAEEVRLNLNPLVYTTRFMQNAEGRREILFNVWLFIPFGILLGKLSRKPVFLLIPFGLSVLIEAAQYFIRIGFCDICDVMNNTLGGILGFILAGVVAGKKADAPAYD